MRRSKDRSEIANEDKAEREGRCATCATRLTPPKPLAAVVKKAAVTKAAVDESVEGHTRKTKSSKAPLAKGSVRRS